MVKELNDDSFEKEINGVKGKVLVDFYADWCGPCKMLSPIMEDISNKHHVFKVNVDTSMELAEEFGISAIPCVLVFEDGKEINRSIGLKTKEEMEEYFK
jgi:thioredoxin 1